MTGVAVIGAGYWGPNLITNFDKLGGVQVHWIVEANPDRANQLRGRFGPTAVVSSHEEALNDDRVDAVVIATPTSTHYDLGIQALEAGRHVMVEKPLAASLEQCHRLCQAADSAGLILMVGHVFLYNQTVRYVKQLLDEDALGQLMHLDMARANLGPIRYDVNAAWDLMPHDLSMLHYWLDGDPISVVASGEAWLNPPIHDVVTAVLKYPGNVHVALRASWLSARKNRDVEIVGKRKMLLFNDNDQAEPIRIYDQGVMGLAERSEPSTEGTREAFVAATQVGDVLMPRVSAGDPLAAECADFIDCIGSGQPPFSSASGGAAVVKVLEAIDRSLKSKQEEAV